ncbi:MAG: hypothetical protein ACFFDF_03345 [Candidatus Odinarchaeota archaeon]
MISFDFNKEIQNYFDSSFSDIELTDWKRWLDMSSNEDYLELSLKLSGLSSIDGIITRARTEKTNSKEISLNLLSFLNSYSDSRIPILCHSSGTTNSNISALKWFHMSINIVKRYWAPGMQAIFESSGLNRRSSAIIFVPSRIKIDGFQSKEGQKYISLYSSEFSQRVMLSIIKPQSYTFYEYKYSKNLDVISKILSLNNISVISAPALTVLGWADLKKFQLGIRRSLENLPKEKNYLLEDLLSTIKKLGLEKASKLIQTKLSEKLSKATLIFSISSLSEQNWSLIRKFMRWEKGKERFTNLYVASEIGPFAASISKEDYEIARFNRMYVFPLTLPVLEHKSKRNLISEISDQTGQLFISRLGESSPLINIDIGDIITVKKSEGLPQIDGNIIRSSFELKYNLKLSDKIKKPSKYNVLAGDFFSFEDFDINQPRNLLNCLKNSCKLETDALLLLQKYNKPWELILPSDLESNCFNENYILEIISNCSTQKDLHQAIANKLVKINFIEDQPVNFLATREEILKMVREGQIPKGILKKWPLYVITTP